MDLKITNNIDANIFSTTVTFDAYGSDQLSIDEEKELIANFPVKISYKNLIFKKNIKIDGTVPAVTDEEADGENVIAVTLPPLSNHEILIDDKFISTYKIDYTKIPDSAVDKNVLTTKALVAHANCLVFSQVICDAVKEKLDEIRSHAPGFEGENIVSV